MAETARLAEAPWRVSASRAWQMVRKTAEAAEVIAGFRLGRVFRVSG